MSFELSMDNELYYRLEGHETIDADAYEMLSRNDLHYLLAPTLSQLDDDQTLWYETKGLTPASDYLANNVVSTHEMMEILSDTNEAFIEAHEYMLEPGSFAGSTYYLYLDDELNARLVYVPILGYVGCVGAREFLSDIFVHMRYDMATGDRAILMAIHEALQQDEDFSSMHFRRLLAMLRAGRRPGEYVTGFVSSPEVEAVGAAAGGANDAAAQAGAAGAQAAGGAAGRAAPAAAGAGVAAGAGAAAFAAGTQAVPGGRAGAVRSQGAAGTPQGAAAGEPVPPANERPAATGKLGALFGGRKAAAAGAAAAAVAGAAAGAAADAAETSEAASSAAPVAGGRFGDMAIPGPNVAAGMDVPSGGIPVDSGKKKDKKSKKDKNPAGEPQAKGGLFGRKRKGADVASANVPGDASAEATAPAKAKRKGLLGRGKAAKGDAPVAQASEPPAKRKGLLGRGKATQQAAAPAEAPSSEQPFIPANAPAAKASHSFTAYLAASIVGLLLGVLTYFLFSAAGGNAAVFLQRLLASPVILFGILGISLVVMIVQLVILHGLMRDVACACAHDGKGGVPSTVLFVLLGIFTFGIYGMVQRVRVAARIRANASGFGLGLGLYGGALVLACELVGLLTLGIGSLVGMFFTVRNGDALIGAYNAVRTE